MTGWLDGVAAGCLLELHAIGEHVEEEFGDAHEPSEQPAERTPWFAEYGA